MLCEGSRHSCSLKENILQCFQNSEASCQNTVDLGSRMKSAVGLSLMIPNPPPCNRSNKHCPSHVHAFLYKQASHIHVGFVHLCAPFHLVCHDPGPSRCPNDRPSPLASVPPPGNAPAFTFMPACSVNKYACMVKYAYHSINNVPASLPCFLPWLGHLFRLSLCRNSHKFHYCQKTVFELPSNIGYCQLPYDL